MDKLWAPWRKAYFAKKMRGCFFCSYLKQNRDARNFIVQRSRYSFSILNLYPYNNGHMMVLPKRHVSEFEDLLKSEREDLLDLFVETKKRCGRVLKPHGFNAGINFGRVAGAGVLGHLHIHLVPRWNGDTNFMPVTGSAKVISESLQEFYSRLKKAMCSEK